MNTAKIAKLCNEIEDIACDISQQTMNDIVSAESRMIFDKAKEIVAEITAPPKTNSEKLAEQSLYELMCDMNASFINGNPHCVLESITGENMICKHESCDHCIAEWLKQEVSEDATD